jgi:hypothetical protein
MRRPEQALAIAAAQYLRLALRPPTVWFAIDHGAGRMTPAAAGLLKARGGRQGVPDLLVLHPFQADTNVVGLELKAPKGRVSDAQRIMAREFRAAGAAYEFCRSLEDVEAVLRGVGIPVFATVAANGSLWPRRAA